MNVAVQSFVSTFVNALREGTAAVFAGAGLSRPAGYVDWRGLLRSIARELQLDIDREHDLIALAQYHVNEKGGNRGHINQLLVDRFTSDTEITQNHSVLSRLPIKTFWTTNYDDLIERSLVEAGKIVDIKVTPTNLATTKPRRDAVVYKMHGDISQPENAVLTKDDFESFENTRHLFSISLQGELVSKTFLFLGYSFSDPNLEYVLSRIRALLGANQREHFCFFKRVSREEYPDESAFNYAVVKQDLRLRDLRRYSITGLLVDKYSEITDLLNLISTKYKRSNVFISGAAADYGTWLQSDALHFVHDLSSSIAQRGYKVYSGFGSEIGTAVLNGVLSHVFSSDRRHIEDSLQLRPFPQFETSEVSKAELWLRYRRTLMSDCGIAVFLFGNKRDENGQIVESDGMLQEFEIALQNGMSIIPVGATGLVGRRIWERLMSDPNHYLPPLPHLHGLLAQLGDEGKSHADLIRLTLGALDCLRDA